MAFGPEWALAAEEPLSMPADAKDANVWSTFRSSIRVSENSIMSPKQTLPESTRLKRNRDFVRVRQKGRPFRCPYFILFACLSDEGIPARIGISASRRVGNAVDRNRAKRYYRELFRINRHRLRSGSDMLLSIRRPSTDASFEDLEHRFLQAIKYLRLLRSNP